MPLADLPPAPYYAVIFTSKLATVDHADYENTALRMIELAAQMDGYLGYESARSGGGFGITISYWRDEEAIGKWREESEHREAQHRGRNEFYQSFAVRVAKVERQYDFRDQPDG